MPWPAAHLPPLATPLLYSLHIQAIVRVGGHFNVKAWSDHVKKQWQGGVDFCFAGSREASIVSVGGGAPAVVKGT